MAYQVIDAGSMEQAPGPHPAASPYDKGIGQALGVRAFGLYQVELPPGAATVRHDHLDDEAEDAYAIVGGSGTLVVDDQEIPVRAGQFIAVTPDSARHVKAGADGMVLIAVCAAPG